LLNVEPTGIEPATSWMQTSTASVTSEDTKALAPSDPAACTAACTSEPKNANADALEDDSPGAAPQAAGEPNVNGSDAGETVDEGNALATLAAALLSLTPTDRARLAKMLLGG
jgi:hypothetical protein